MMVAVFYHTPKAERLEGLDGEADAAGLLVAGQLEPAPVVEFDPLFVRLAVFGGRLCQFLQRQFRTEYDVGVRFSPVELHTARWLEAVRQAVVEHIKRGMMARLKIPGDEYDTEAATAHDARVLHDESIGVHMPCEAVDHLTCPVQFVGFEQGIDGDIDLDPPIVGQSNQLSQLLEGKILGLHACRHAFETAVNGIGTGSQSRQKCGPVARRGQNGRLMGSDLFHLISTRKKYHSKRF